jgi:hypothetical protein
MQGKGFMMPPLECFLSANGVLVRSIELHFPIRQLRRIERLQYRMQISSNRLPRCPEVMVVAAWLGCIGFRKRRLYGWGGCCGCG